MRLLLQLLQLLLPLLLLLLLPLRLPAQQCLRRHCCAGIAVQANAWTALPAQQCLHRHCCADIAVQALQCSHFGPLVCPHPGPGVALAVLSRDARGTLAGSACAGVPVQACLCRRACAGVPVQAFLAGIPAQECVQAFVHGNVCRHSCAGMFAGIPAEECLAGIPVKGRQRHRHSVPELFQAESARNSGHARNRHKLKSNTFRQRIGVPWPAWIKQQVRQRVGPLARFTSFAPVP